jgi:hypothetical protein
VSLWRTTCNVLYEKKKFSNVVILIAIKLRRFFALRQMRTCAVISSMDGRLSPIFPPWRNAHAPQLGRYVLCTVLFPQNTSTCCCDFNALHPSRPNDTILPHPRYFLGVSNLTLFLSSTSALDEFTPQLNLFFNLTATLDYPPFDDTRTPSLVCVPHCLLKPAAFSQRQIQVHPHEPTSAHSRQASLIIDQSLSSRETLASSTFTMNRLCASHFAHLH